MIGYLDYERKSIAWLNGTPTPGPLVGYRDTFRMCMAWLDGIVPVVVSGSIRHSYELECQRLAPYPLNGPNIAPYELQ